MVLLFGFVLFLGVVCIGISGKPVCNKDEFPCTDGSCIQKAAWCDSELDCADKSDEEFCFLKSNLRRTPNNCDETFFRCKNGPCIPLVGHCDGYFSCRDNSDEEGCQPENSTEIYNPSTIFIHFDYSTDELPETQHLPELTEKTVTRVDETAVYEDTVLADSSSSAVKTAEDLRKDFKDINPKDFAFQRVRAKQWLLSVRDKNYGWGDETPRALTALYIGVDDLVKQEDSMLMSKQLHVQLFTALIRNHTAPVPLWDLSLFINALSATCSDPRNFYGQDLVEILRGRADTAESSGVLLSPVVYLTLCLNGMTSRSDIERLTEIINYTSKMDKVDTEALVSLCATCISKTTKFASYTVLQDITTRFYLYVLQLGLPKSIYKLALVTQALNEAGINQMRWNRSEALHRIIHYQDSNGSFGDILSAYYTIPVLSGRSLLSLEHHCHSKEDEEFIPLEILKNGDGKKIYVHYSLYFGEPVEVSQTLMIRAKNMTNFVDIMRMAEAINPVYEFKYDMNEGRLEVYSIGGVVNDPERGLYWKLHVASKCHSTTLSKLLPYEGDIKSFKPCDGDSIVFWMKSLY